ncbi:ROK family transcriptional regulator [Martelella mediterranea]|uniref:Putative NBD/HSP70 family sugar kinase n=1 Tax=Martelella mediterranea TaxID=293089 RepID=A0A4R3NQ13_9HYPH|nr:ROK family transcriptional regulator [Martelella mediterranea]TCT33075.1 putative NBD/HSP70 family sugar kinase [Martelella mediterranea]
MTTHFSGDGQGHKDLTTSRGSNQSGVRAHNERLVLSTIRRNGPLAKAEIARRTGLSIQTSAVIVRSLEQEGLLKRGEPVRGRIGQPSVPMGLAPDGAFFFGLKIGRRSADIVLLNFIGEVLDSAHLVYDYPRLDEMMAFVLPAVARMRTAVPQERLAGMGIAIPFRIWDWARIAGVATGQMDAWRTRDIRAELEASIGLPVYLQNDASAACGAELAFGKGERPPDFLHFFIGYFIGGGLVLDNRLYTGRSGNAAALGSLPIAQADGSYCQLADTASLCLLERAMNLAGQSSECLWGPPDDWLVEDSLLEPWLDETCRSLAVAIIASCCVVDVGTVLIDGWLPDNVRAEIVARTAAILERTDAPGIEKPEIAEGTIGPNGRSLGAASLPLSDRYLVDLNAVLVAG